MFRVPRPAVTVFAGFVLAVAAACSSSSATSTGQVAGASAVAVNQSDPNSILNGAMSSAAQAKSFHIALTASGTIKQSALSDASGGSGPAAALGGGGDLKLDGTTLEGDVDVANQAAHLTFSLPSMNLSGDLIAVDKALYYKVSLLGPKYAKLDLNSLTAGLPIPSLPAATPGASDMAAMQELNQLQQQLKDAGFKATLVGVDQISGKDAYHVAYTIPIDYINAQIAAEASGGPSMTLDSASFDTWIYKADNRPAKAELKAASSSVGSLDLTVTVTDYDKPVTISAPDPSQVQAVAP